MAGTDQIGSAISPPFLTIRAAARKYAQAGFSESSLRWIAFNRDHNGFASAFVKVGRRLLLDEAEFVSCIRGARAGGQKAAP